MAVNSLGYRKWSGKLAWPGMRIVVIATTGIRRAWQSSWLRRCAAPDTHQDQGDGIETKIPAPGAQRPRKSSSSAGRVHEFET